MAVLNGFQRQDGRFAAVYDAPLKPSESHAATFDGDVFEMGELSTLRLLLDVASMTGTLDVDVETSHDGANDWRVVGSFTQATGAGTERKVFAGCDRFVRVACAIGTGPADFSVTGSAC